MTASLLALDRVHVSVRMLPVRLALCDLKAPGWGEPWFPHCAVVASWLTDYCMAPLRFVVSLDFLAIPIHEVIQCYHLFLYVSDACELIS